MGAPPNTAAGERGPAEVCFVSTVALLLFTGIAAFRGGSPNEVLLPLAASFIPYAGLFRYPLAVSHSRLFWLVAGGIVIASVPMVASPPVFSDDLYRYLWDGEIVRQGINPYRYAPDDPALAEFRDPLWRKINNSDIPTIYPPVAQLVFAVAGVFGKSAAVLKAICVAAHIATTWLVGRLTWRREAVAVYGLNPLVVSEVALGGHVDIIAGLFLVGALATMARALPTAVLLGVLSVGTKLVGLALVPFLARARRARLFIVLGVALVLLPMLLAGGAGAGSGASQFARRWSGNESAFAMVEINAGTMLRLIGWWTGSPKGELRVPGARPLLVRIADTPFDPWAANAVEKKPIADRAKFDIDHLSGLLARVVVASAWLLLATFMFSSRFPPLIGLRWLLLAALLLSPQVHVWYLLWLLPLEAATGRRAVFFWSIGILLAYLPVSGWIAERVWDEPAFVRPVQYGLLALGLGLDAVGDREESYTQGSVGLPGPVMGPGGRSRSAGA
ncbi:MAG: hypothetical protein AAGF12_18495 [Myxococcota bacterium]